MKTSYWPHYQKWPSFFFVFFFLPFSFTIHNDNFLTKLISLLFLFFVFSSLQALQTIKRLMLLPKTWQSHLSWLFLYFTVIQTTTIEVRAQEQQCDPPPESIPANYSDFSAIFINQRIYLTGGNMVNNIFYLLSNYNKYDSNKHHQYFVY